MQSADETKNKSMNEPTEKSSKPDETKPKSMPTGNKPKSDEKKSKPSEMKLKPKTGARRIAGGVRVQNEFVALRAEDFEGAVAASTRAMDADLPCGRLARLLLVRASAHLGLREFDAAISDAETSLALEPDGESAAGALLRLGRALEGLGKPVEAIERGCASRTCPVLRLRTCSYCAAHMRLRTCAALP